MYTYEHVRVDMYIYMYIYIYISTTCSYVYIHTHAYTYVYIGSYIVVYYIVLCCIIIYYTVLHCAIPYHTVLIHVPLFLHWLSCFLYCLCMVLHRCCVFVCGFVYGLNGVRVFFCVRRSHGCCLRVIHQSSSNASQRTPDAAMSSNLRRIAASHVR